MDVLMFEVAGQTGAVPLASVEEVFRAAEVTPLPGAPPSVQGVLDVRGRIVPVVCVRARFSLESGALEPSEHFILAKAGPRMLALRVDRALGLADLPNDRLIPAADVVAGARRVASFTGTDNGIVLIYDLEAFLSAAEAEQLDLALREASEAAEDA